MCISGLAHTRVRPISGGYWNYQRRRDMLHNTSRKWRRRRRRWRMPLRVVVCVHTSSAQCDKDAVAMRAGEGAKSQGIRPGRHKGCISDSTFQKFMRQYMKRLGKLAFRCWDVYVYQYCDKDDISLINEHGLVLLFERINRRVLQQMRFIHT